MGIPLVVVGHNRLVVVERSQLVVEHNLAAVGNLVVVGSPLVVEQLYMMVVVERRKPLGLVVERRKPLGLVVVVPCRMEQPCLVVVQPLAGTVDVRLGQLG